MNLARAHRASPLVVQGTVRVPGDKSISHRALILAAMARGQSRVRSVLESADVHSTASVLRALGAHIPELSASFVVESGGVSSLHSPSETLDCGNSGTTARLVAGMVAGCAGVVARFDGDASLRKRPMRRIASPLREMGAVIDFEAPGERLPMTVHGATLNVVEYHSEHASAQVKSALLLAALASRTGVTVREPFASRDHTERMLAARGVSLELLHDGVRLGANQEVAAADIDVPADPSSAAFIAALAALADTGSITLDDVCLNPTRTGFFELLARMGAQVNVVQPRVTCGETVGTIVVSPGHLAGVTVRGSDIPRCIDELPMLACLATRAEGETRVLDAAELRVKESDRIGAVVANLRAIGAAVDELADGFVVRGTATPLRGRVATHGDHRLAMAFGVLAACPENNIEIDEPSCVAVSYPNFWADLDAVVARAQPRETTVPLMTTQRTVIAIDGPAASGKSSTAKWVAERLGVRHVDSGAFYRALTAIALETAADGDSWNEELVLGGAKRVSLHLTRHSVIPAIDGQVVDERLRSQAVTRQVSRVAQMPRVREWVNDRVREAASTADVVVDGRDIGTAVFPNAALKVFLIADPWERARRRLLQRLGRLPVDEEIAEETERLVARDALDATQSAPARDAVTIDTTRLTQEEQVDRIVTLARAATRIGS